MSKVVYIGDAVAAAAWRLTGARCLTPTVGESVECLIAELATSVDLILLATPQANALPEAVRAKLVRAERPLTLLLPDANAGPAELIARVRAQLGLET